MADFAETIEKMLALFKANRDLFSAVKHFQFGLPPRYTIFPTLAVAWRGGPTEYESGDVKVYVHDYFVTVVDQGTDPEALERSVLGLVKMVEDVIDADPTIDGTGYDAKVSPMIAERAVEGDKLFLGAMLTIKTWSE